MSGHAVRVDSLSKQYVLGQWRAHDTLRDHLAHAFSVFSRAPRERQRPQTIWALRDVSFDVPRGEVVGIIGNNGAGKSTLLKILSRITEPTSGYAEIHGRVGSLLEVGAGFFHPELTGRENIYLSGAILGMKKSEIDRKRDGIIEFAGIGPFIDTPVKRYSSGMNMRLAFSVAAHLDQEILFVDEVLAVGDAEFQRKCLGRMGEVSREGRTVLFVSHNMAAITHLCPRTLWLKGGRIQADGASTDVVSAYLSSGQGAGSAWRNPSSNRPSMDGAFRVGAARVLSEDSQPASVIEFRRPFKIEIEYEILRPLKDVAVVVRVINSIGEHLWTSWDTDPERWDSGLLRMPGRYVSVCTVPPHFLKPGPYRVDVGARSATPPYELHESVLAFEISEVGYTLHPGRLGVVAPLLGWEVTRVEGAHAGVSESSSEPIGAEAAQ